jgi:hypothetical protein
MENNINIYCIKMEQYETKFHNVSKVSIKAMWHHVD